MRQLKTTEEIRLEAIPLHNQDEDFVDVCIKLAQRDALECAAERAKTVRNYNPDFIIVDKSSILNLMPNP